MKEHRTFNVNELFQELERNGRRHRWYFHYTTLDVMDKILANGMLFLSRVGKMNDGKEADTMPDNIFAACFSASGTESVAMWNTYGIPRRDAVRLCFDGCLVRKFLDGKFGVLKCHARNKDGIVIDEIPPEKVELKMFDVIYASTGGRHFQYREKHCTVTDENGKALNLLRGKFAGYAKMCGWSYEREVRLLLTLKKDYVVPDMEKVSIDFSGVVKCMKTNKLIYKAYPILLGPWTIPSKRDELAKRKLKVGKSLFTGYLDNLKTVCDKCTKSCMAKCKCAHKYAR